MVKAGGQPLTASRGLAANPLLLPPPCMRAHCQPHLQQRPCAYLGCRCRCRGQLMVPDWRAVLRSHPRTEALVTVPLLYSEGGSALGSATFALTKGRVAAGIEHWRGLAAGGWGVVCVCVRPCSRCAWPH